MNGAHDLGGMQNLGPIRPDRNEPVFARPWERRMFGVAQAVFASGEWNIDRNRATTESIPPADYLSMGYYELWYTRIVKLLTSDGFIDPSELEAGHASQPAKPIRNVLEAGMVPAGVRRGNSSARTATAPARFKAGDAVRARRINPATHTRLPRYARGVEGTVLRVHGVHVFPDTNALGLGEHPTWVYAVAFNSDDLWGPLEQPSFEVVIDAWEPYLEPL
ncbi:nitrile hydratase [Devosia lucknowensis]|uniref:Nitrile hydratase subunit beta n=1 Tax=Devosia lucknowensis TaxID=1096929 RepID=A0A1Y6G8P5_9HYPH|nr:nitrile hydratase subunit beta [Devosia lucknowensis]SMQ85703.1 nitrile hydratase [Devosia lucknowensis]